MIECNSALSNIFINIVRRVNIRARIFQSIYLFANMGCSKLSYLYIIFACFHIRYCYCSIAYTRNWYLILSQNSPPWSMRIYRDRLCIYRLHSMHFNVVWGLEVCLNSLRVYILLHSAPLPILGAVWWRRNGRITHESILSLCNFTQD